MATPTPEQWAEILKRYSIEDLLKAGKFLDVELENRRHMLDALRPLNQPGEYRKGD